MKKNLVDKNRISLAGEFAVLSKLSFLGFEASLTLGNTKGVDILVLNPKTEKMFRVEVKTSYKKGNYVLKKSKDFGEHIQWIWGKKVEENNSKNLFYCFVILDEKGSQRFIIPSKIVSEYCKIGQSHWLSSGKNRKANDMRAFRLGTDKNFKYPIKTPLGEDFQK